MKKLLSDFIRDMERLKSKVGNIEVTYLRECEACYKLTEDNTVRFYRVDKHLKKKIKHEGFSCKCGYLNSDKRL